MTNPTPADETAVRILYEKLLTAWNERSAERFAALFAEDTSTEFHGRPELTQQLTDELRRLLKSEE
jgi:uncharacterized protein (TIGR02246 family)